MVVILLILFICIGFVLSILMFIAGVIYGLLKKKWKLARNSIILFIIVIAVYSISQVFYLAFVAPSASKYLYNNSPRIVSPKPIDK